MKKLFLMLALIPMTAPSMAHASVCFVRVYLPANPPPVVDIYSCDGKKSIPDNPPDAAAFLDAKLKSGYKISGQSQDADGNLMLTLTK